MSCVRSVTALSKICKNVLAALTDTHISNSYTMGYPPVRGDNPRALASGLSCVQADNPSYNFFYTTHISVDRAHHEIFRA